MCDDHIFMWKRVAEATAALTGTAARCEYEMSIHPNPQGDHGPVTKGNQSNRWIGYGFEHDLDILYDTGSLS